MLAYRPPNWWDPIPTSKTLIRSLLMRKEQARLTKLKQGIKEDRRKFEEMEKELDKLNKKT